MIHSDGIHVVSDMSLEELHEWAKRYGLKRHWFHRGRWPHYDLPKRHLHYTAEIGTTRQLIEAMRNGPISDELKSKRRTSSGLLDDDSIKLLQNEGILPKRKAETTK